MIAKASRIDGKVYNINMPNKTKTIRAPAQGQGAGGGAQGNSKLSDK